jgi:hypothetical protein
LETYIDGKLKKVGVRGKDQPSNIMNRAKKWMHMVYYDNDRMTKNAFDKLTSKLIRYSSLSYVAFNVFGNLNNYTIARINNMIETAGGRFYEPYAMRRATWEFNKRAMPDLMRATAFIGTKGAYEIYVPRSKYEILVGLFRMMDDKADIREVERLGKKESWLKRKLDWGYLLNDSFEYNVQTKVGMAILMSKTIKNSKTDETLSLYDAFEVHGDGTATLKEGYDTIVEKNGKEKKWNDNTRHDIRNEIREVNKQIHGNYAHEDRMVIQAHALGQLGAQFHKWVIPAIKARYRTEYFDENVGWLEGRYRSFMSFMVYAFKNLHQINKWGTNFKEQYEDSEKAEMKMKNVYRTLGEIGMMLSTTILLTLMKGLFEDDDDDSVLQKRLENVLLYQADRAYKEMVQFIPIPGTGGLEQIYQMMKSPIASTRTLGELGEAMSSTVALTWHSNLFTKFDDDFYENSKVVYQNKPKKGKFKASKQWADAVPIWYSFQRWNSFDREHDFHIK